MSDGFVVVDVADFETSFSAANTFDLGTIGPPALGAGGTRPDLALAANRNHDCAGDRWWAYYDAIPRIRSAARIHETEVSSATFSIGWRPDLLTEPLPLAQWEGTEHTPPEPPAEVGAALETLVRIGGDSVGVAIGDIATKRWVSGRCYLLAFVPEDGRRTESEATTTAAAAMDDERARQILTDPAVTWMVVSDQECRSRLHGGRRVWQVDNLAEDDPTETSRWFAASNLIVADLIRRHPKRRSLPDTALRPLAGDCDALLALLKTVRIVANSQASAGILTIPSTMENQGVDRAEDGARQGPKKAAQLLADSLTAAVKSETARGAFLPLVLKGPWEQLRAIRWIEMRRNFDSALVQLIELYDQRIAVGLDQQTEETSGVQDSNHWSAAEARSRQLDRWSGRDAADVASLVTRAMIRPILAAHGHTDAWQWSLVVDTSSMDTAREQWMVMELGSQGLMKASAVLRLLGFDPDDAVEAATPAGDASTAGAPTAAPEQQQQLGQLARAAQAMLGESLARELEAITAQPIDIPPADLARMASAAGIDLDGDHRVHLDEVTGIVLREAARILGEDGQPDDITQALATQLAAEWRAALLAA